MEASEPASQRASARLPLMTLIFFASRTSGDQNFKVKEGRRAPGQALGRVDDEDEDEDDEDDDSDYLDTSRGQEVSESCINRFSAPRQPLHRSVFTYRHIHSLPPLSELAQ